MSLPILPYNGSSGHSGSSTSKARADHLDKSGKTSKYQFIIMDFLCEKGEFGATWREIADLLGVHHGTASGALSVLHKAGLLERLKETRDKSKIYVLPEFVMFRETEAPKKTKQSTIGHAAIFSYEGGEILVRSWKNGSTTIAFREYPSDTWSPPIRPDYTQELRA
jgi:DNA-binding transcriptional ArsR family regulator